MNEEKELSRRKVLAEIEKLETESQEVRRRIEVKWYQGRFLIQSVVGGTVAAALFVTWFIGFFSPYLEQKATEEYRKDIINKDRLIRSYVAHLDSIGDGHHQLAELAKRVDGTINKRKAKLRSKKDMSFQEEKDVEYLSSLGAEVRSLTERFEFDIKRTDNLSTRLKNGLTFLSNSGFTMHVVYQSHYDSHLAYTIARHFESRRYQTRVSSWSEWRSDNESMFEFFERGEPVLIYSLEDQKTAHKSGDVEILLRNLLPEYMQIRHAQDVEKSVDLSRAWDPGPNSFELWLMGE
jgi:hypothetical protein